MRRLLVLLAAFALFAPLALAGSTARPVRYPEGYRAWTHVKSMVILPGHPLYDAFGGIHHIYANPAALEALRRGSPFPDGAVLVFDLLEARQEEGAIVEGARKVVGVMEKHARDFAATGGWGFEAFKGDTRQRLVTDPAKACFACHAAQQASDYVFSRFRP
ncbi:MAG: cytochrome P460 [Candidatus Tectimicrobiota bacterium]|nr:MAG: cytochrome P460 [Candidatus Tectomicrobia bacterium]